MCTVLSAMIRQANSIGNNRPIHPNDTISDSLNADALDEAKM